MNIPETLKQFASLYPIDTLQSKVDFAVRFAPEEIKFMIPCIELGTEGTTLRSLILVTDQYLCEVRMAGGSFHDVDYVAKETISNFRFKAWTHEIKENEVVKAKYELSEVKLNHGLGDFLTTLSFAGNIDDRDKWLNHLIEALPVNMILGYSCKS